MGKYTCKILYSELLPGGTSVIAWCPDDISISPSAVRFLSQQSYAWVEITGKTGL
jgi:hypothetical protein